MELIPKVGIVLEPADESIDQEKSQDLQLFNHRCEACGRFSLEIRVIASLWWAAQACHTAKTSQWIQFFIWRYLFTLPMFMTELAHIRLLAPFTALGISDNRYICFVIFDEPFFIPVLQQAGVSFEFLKDKNCG
jgi:hypothetical protein